MATLVPARVCSSCDRWPCACDSVVWRVEPCVCGGMIRVDHMTDHDEIAGRVALHQETKRHIDWRARLGL